MYTSGCDEQARNHSPHMDREMPDFDGSFNVIFHKPEYLEEISLFRRDAYLKEVFFQVSNHRTLTEMETSHNVH